MNEFEVSLRNGAAELGIAISEEHLEKFEAYRRYFLEYNSHTNLTAITAPADIAIKHFLDSLLFSKVVNLKKGDRIIDVGTGAGFPGVPIKIFNPEIKLTLLDSVRKKVEFLEKLMSKIDVNYSVLHERAEILARKKEYRDSFDYAVARAVAPLNNLSEYCLPFIRATGYFVAFKGPNIEEEIEVAQNSIKILRGELQKTENFNLPQGSGVRNLIIIKKTGLTPEKYPRNSGKAIKNHPL